MMCNSSGHLRDVSPETSNLCAIETVAGHGNGAQVVVFDTSLTAAFALELLDQGLVVGLMGAGGG
jgi:hypothetical protein